MFIPLIVNIIRKNYKSKKKFLRKKWLPGKVRIQNRGPARYMLQCLVIIYVAARAAALQNVFEYGLPLPPFFR
jgi:hypothetical protein